MDPFAPIEIVILGRVNQVETGDPTKHACAQNKRRKIDIPGLRNPGANRRDREGEAKEKMRRRGKSFGQRVKKYDGKGDRRQQKREPIDSRSRGQKRDRTKSQRNYDCRFSKQQVTRSRARIPLIERPIDQTIEKHGGRARAHHADEHEQQYSS